MRSRNHERSHKVHDIMKLNYMLTLTLSNSRTLNYKRFYDLLIIIRNAYVISADEKDFKLYYINNYID